MSYYVDVTFYPKGDPKNLQEVQMRVEGENEFMVRRMVWEEMSAKGNFCKTLDVTVAFSA